MAIRRKEATQLEEIEFPEDVAGTDVFEKCFRYTRTDAAEAAGLLPFFIPLQSETATTAVVRGHRVLMFGSNNYLGLAQDERVRRAAVDAVERFGPSCTGSRLLNGTLDLHEELERRLAAFFGRDSAIIFTTGFQTNLGVISTIAGRNDYIVVDSASHASIRDGCRLSYATTVKFRHNDMTDLERTLKSVPAGRGILIVVDGVYSMEGDLANLPEIVQLKRRFNARLIVDDAHAIGVMGASGRGTAEHFGVEDEVDIITGTFSKSFASIGGFFVADAKVAHFIRHTARALMFSASPSPAAVAAAQKALEIIETEPELRQRVLGNADRLRGGLNRLGFDTGASETPIIPVVIGPELQMGIFWHGLLNDGVYTNAVVSPAVPPDRALLRMSCTAAHTHDEIDEALATMERIGRRLKLI